VVGRAQAEQLLAESKVHLLKKRQEAMADTLVTVGADPSEAVASSEEESAAECVAVGLPQERQRIADLLEEFPGGMETKTRVLLDALRQVWQINPEEKAVVFATYLGTVDNIKAAIERTFPDKGVEVLKGGDHGAKTAAQKRFKRKDGPRVMVCTAAGREGINLQFARLLFNFDLPWNPMDLEQRIGRIHRYGQKDTAQVYNLVAADTIEGQIFLMLEEKLKSIASALGKVDDQGQVAEDLRSQVLGQLSSQISYDKLYQEALKDPSLKRTQQEIDVAMSNANLARNVVFELFQNLDKFSVGDYRKFDDEGRGMQRLVEFVQRAARLDGGEFRPKGDDLYELRRPGQNPLTFTTDRDKALENDTLDLLGLEHPAVKAWLDKWSALSPADRYVAGALDGDPAAGVLTIWHVVINAKGGQTLQRVVRLGMNLDGERSSGIERASANFLAVKPRQIGPEQAVALRPVVSDRATGVLHRELMHSGLLQEGASYSCRLLACMALLQICTPTGNHTRGTEHESRPT
jgi:hypothetical protein